MSAGSEQKKKSSKGSKIAKKTAARLFASQAVYQILMHEQNARSVVSEFIEHRFHEDVDGEELVTPDTEMFKRIVLGVSENKDDIRTMISNARKKGETTLEDDADETSIEPLLHSIMHCGAFELMQPDGVDAPIIISDYLHVTDAFYDQNEKKLVNAVLDKVRQFLSD